MEISHTVAYISFLWDLKRCKVKANLFLLPLTIVGILLIILIISFEFPIKYLLICLALLHTHFSMFFVCWCVHLGYLTRDEGREEMSTSLKVRVFTYTQYCFLECINHYKSVISFNSQISNSCGAIFCIEGYFWDLKKCAINMKMEPGCFRIESIFSLCVVWKNQRWWFYGPFVFVTL